MVEKIILARPRGFCAGVTRAISIVLRSIEKKGSPIYVRHEIVHNEYVIQELKQQGVIFKENLNEFPKGSNLILSAHGSSPEIIKQAKEDFKIIDAVCPLVKKIHLQAKRFHKEGYSILFIGKKGHPEAIGTMGYAPMQLVSSINDAKNIQPKYTEKIAYLMQTTMSMDDAKDIIDILKKRFPKIISSPTEDICFATQNRQNAVKDLAKESDIILILGSKTSSNSKSLAKIAKKYCHKAHLILDKKEIEKKWFIDAKTIGITAGASSPEVLVQQVIEYIKEIYPNIEIIENEYVKEDMKFSLPEELLEQR